MVTALLTQNVQINHANIAAYVTPFNQAFGNPAIAQAMNPYTAAGRAALDGVVTLQATVISYMNDFKLMMILSLAAIPLVLLLRKPGTPAKVDHSAVME